MWKSNGKYGKTKDSFIFSFKNGIENYILSRVVNEKIAVYYDLLITPIYDDRDFQFGKW